ncbi:MAG: ATP-binding protein [Patescibacteria group bacterium]
MSFGEVEFALLVLVALVNLFLVSLVLRSRARRQDAIFFALFGISQTIWIMVNFFAINSTHESILNFAKWTIAAAIPHPLLFYLLTKSFLHNKSVIGLKRGFLFLFLMVLMVFIARSPFLFTHLDTTRHVPTPVAGPGMLLFAIYSLAFISLAIVTLVRSWRLAKGIVRQQWKFLGIGLITTVTLVLIFNFIYPVALQDLSSVRYGHLYTLPFVLFTSYAIIRHHLLNIRVIATELLVGALILVSLLEFITSPTLVDFIGNGLILTTTIVIGVMLVRSVVREIERRKQIESLAKELETANKKLKKLDEAKTEFLSITSHQLRTPLSSIKGYLSMIIAGDFGNFNKEQNESLTRVYDEVERLARLVQVFLNVSRIESGRLKIAQVDFDVKDLITDVVNQLHPIAQKKGLELDYVGAGESLPFTGDSDKLKDVMVNLVDNAIKYTPAGKVWVTTEKKPDSVIVKVHDTGVGIDPEYAEHLFEKFSRAKGIAQIDAGGTGLGLFIVKKIIEGHGGSIAAKSQGEGKGTTFVVELPLKKQAKNA